MKLRKELKQKANLLYELELKQRISPSIDNINQMERIVQGLNLEELILIDEYLITTKLNK